MDNIKLIRRFLSFCFISGILTAQGFAQDYCGAISLYELFSVEPKYTFTIEATNVTSIEIWSDFLLNEEDNYENALLYKWTPLQYIQRNRRL
jgi:hypothetical protein